MGLFCVDLSGLILLLETVSNAEHRVIERTGFYVILLFIHDNLRIDVFLNFNETELKSQIWFSKVYVPFQILFDTYRPDDPKRNFSALQLQCCEQPHQSRIMICIKVTNKYILNF